jgi:hypothetical protein
MASQTYFQALSAAVGAVTYSDKTEAGKPINEKMSEKDADDELLPLINYLEKNLIIVCQLLRPEIAKGVIINFWNAILETSANALVPPLYGIHNQKYLNVRQSSMFKHFVVIMREFFHGDGGELGIELGELDSPFCLDLQDLIKLYHYDLEKIKHLYEVSLRKRAEKEMLLRLVHLRAEKGSADADWVSQQLVARKDTKTV